MLSLKQVNVKTVKIMSKNTSGKEKNNWSLSIGIYPGILLGARTYDEDDRVTHVIYLPFIDIALEIYN
tara:strand:- start:185 stop:388 length:204 start_codon:yes stop_codon:yes gene_type:complete